MISKHPVPLQDLGINPEELKARTKQFALRVMKMTDALPRSAK